MEERRKTITDAVLALAIYLPAAAFAILIAVAAIVDYRRGFPFPSRTQLVFLLITAGLGTAYIAIRVIRHVLALVRSIRGQGKRNQEPEPSRSPINDPIE